jgi:hypothetical protein
VFLPCGLHAQGLQLDWVRRYSADGATNNQAFKIVKAPDGVVVGGNSRGPGKSDYVIAKYKSNGDEAWVRRYNGGADSNDVLRDITVDPLGNVFVTGTSHTVKYAADGNLVWTNALPGRAILATTNFVYITGCSDVDYVTAKIENNTTGQQIWLRTYDGPVDDTDISDGLALTKDGDLLVAGNEVVSKTSFLPPQSGFRYTVRLAFLKYTPNGDQAQFGPSLVDAGGSPGVGTVRSFLIDDSGIVYIYYRDGNDGIGFMCKDATGTLMGSKSLTFYSLGGLGDMALVGNGAAVVVGATRTVANGPIDAYVEVIRRDGTTVWNKTFSSGYRSSSYGDSSDAYGVVVNAEGIYAVGHTPDADGSYGLFVVGYTTNGVPLGSIIYSSGSNKIDWGTSITSDDSGNIYVTGTSSTPQGRSEFLTARFSKHPTIKADASGAMEVEFYTSPDQLYSIEASVDFFNWESLMTNTADANGVARFLDSSGVGAPKRFYRGKKP